MVQEIFDINISQIYLGGIANRCLKASMLISLIFLMTFSQCCG